MCGLPFNVYVYQQTQAYEIDRGGPITLKGGGGYEIDRGKL